MEDQGRPPAVPGRARPEPLPEAAGASDSQAPDHVQQLVHEAQLLLGTGPALGREGHMHSLARHATCPQPAAGPAGPLATCPLPSSVVDWLGAPGTARQAVAVACAESTPCGEQGLVPKGRQAARPYSQASQAAADSAPTPKAAGSPSRELSGQELNSFLLPERGGGSRMIPMM